MVERAVINKEEDNMSNLWHHYKKLEPGNPELESHNLHINSHSKMELINVNKLVGPAVLIPDLAHSNKRAYLWMVPVWEWAHMFNERNFDKQQEPAGQN